MSKIKTDSGCVIGFLMTLIYVLLIITSVPFSILWVLPIIFCIVTLLIAEDQSSDEKKHNKALRSIIDQNQKLQSSRIDSYVRETSIGDHGHVLLIDDINTMEPLKSEAKFCQSCGKRRLKTAKYCYKCGSKLE